MVAHTITMSRDDGTVLTDREMLMLSDERRQQEAAALQEVQHYQNLAVGMAALCCTFYDALQADELKRFTKEEIMELLKHVVQGR